VGWIPYFLERADFVYKHHGAWIRCEWGGKLPSEVFREHFLSCFIDDKFGCESYKSVGENIIAYECDYPHSDCTWPNVAEELWENVKNLSDRIIDKITHQNVFDFFGVDPIAEVGGRQNADVKGLRALAKEVDTTERSLPGKDARIIGNPDRPVTAEDVWATLVAREELAKAS
jgi:hypothetical protein